MEKTGIAFGENSWKSLLNGIKQVSSIVMSTIGPDGDNVVIERRFKAPLVTNDGVTVAKHIQLDNPIENMGANLLLQAGLRTNYEAGDGTTTTIGLAKELLHDSLVNMDEGRTKREVIDMLIKTRDEYIKLIYKEKKRAEISDILNIARVSSQNEDIAQLVTEAFDKLGENVIINISDGLALDHKIEVNNGLAFDSGMLNYFFAADKVKKESRFAEAMIFLCDDELNSKEQIIEILQIASDHKKPALIIAPNFSDVVLRLMLFNAEKGAIQVTPVIPNGTRQEKITLIADLQILLQAEEGYAPGTMMAIAGINVSTKQTIINMKKETPEEANSELEHIKKQLEKTKSETEKTQLNKRLALYAGGYANISVGGDTEAEIEELKLRTEDAVLAVKATIKNGYVKGGGELMKKFGKDNNIQAFISIAEAIEKNTNQVSSYDILDPAEVHIQSIKNAVSFVKTILTTNGAIYFKPKENAN